MANKYKFKGINDEHDTCSACHKTGLKRVVWLAPLSPDGDELGDPEPYGTDCAAKLLGVSRKTRAKTEQAVLAALRDQIRQKITQIRNNEMIVVGQHFWPKELSAQRSYGPISVEEMIAYRNAKWPILRFANAVTEKDINEAAKYL